MHTLISMIDDPLMALLSIFVKTGQGESALFAGTETQKIGAGFARVQSLICFSRG